MAVFKYIGLRSANSKKTQGSVDAESEREARRILKSRGIFPINIQRGVKLRTAERGKHLNILFHRQPQQNITELILFTRQLGNLQEAGFTLVDSLRCVEKQVGSPTARGIIVELQSAVVEGRSLSDAMGEYPAVYPEFYRNLVQAGEASGSLEKVLNRLAEMLERQQEIKSRLLSAMIYPMVMMTAGFFVLIFLLSVVVPKIIVVFADSKQALPLVTRSLLALSSFFAHWGILFVLIILLLASAGIYWLRTEAGGLKFEKFLLSLPLLGTFFRRLITLRFCQTLQLLLVSGVPIIESIMAASRTIGWRLAAQRMRDVARAVGQGTSLAEPLKNSGLVDEIAVRMIQSGEDTGTLEQMLARIAVQYDGHCRRFIERSMTFVEPMIVMVMGAVVAYVVVAVMLPVFEMNRLIH